MRGRALLPRRARRSAPRPPAGGRGPRHGSAAAARPTATCSSPSTTPSTIPRRSPVQSRRDRACQPCVAGDRPGRRDHRGGRRSASGLRAGRRGHRDAGARFARRSRPSAVAEAAPSSTASRTAPCGGARPGGSSSSTASRRRSRPNRRTWPGTRSSNRVLASGCRSRPHGHARRCPPGRAARSGRGPARRALPHHHAEQTRAAQVTQTLRSPGAAIAPQPTAPAATAAGHEPRARLANARPTQSDAARRCGEARLGRHGATRSRSCSSREGPMPGTASSSSTEANAPCFMR